MTTLYYNQAAWIPVTLLGLGGPVTGLTHEDIAVSVRWCSDSPELLAYALTADKWREVGDGVYEWYLQALSAAEADFGRVYWNVTGDTVLSAIDSAPIVESLLVNYIRMHLQPSVDPVLTDAEFNALVDLAAIADPDGLSPTDDDWTPTYDVTAAISQGWEVKAAKVAGAYAFIDAGLSLHRDQVHQMCLKQAALWRSRAGGADGSGTIRVTSETIEDAAAETEEILD